jgi:hypothetical protein
MRFFLLYRETAVLSASDLDSLASRDDEQVIRPV